MLTYLLIIEIIVEKIMFERRLAPTLLKIAKTFPATLLTGHFLPANLPEYFIIPRDAKVSAIISSGGGTIYVTPMGR